MITGFTVKNKKMTGLPTEDSYLFDRSNKIISVADGVTRDPLQVLPDTSTKKGRLEFIQNYPKQSPAKKAADCFCYNLLNHLKKLKKHNKKSIKKSFELSNKSIKKLNNKLGLTPKTTDYLTKDLAGCVGAGAIIEKNKILFGYICDCGLALFNKEGKLKEKTIEYSPHIFDTERWKYIKGKIGSAEWKEPESRVIIRKHFRNKKSFRKYGFGVLTGETSALKHVKTGIWRIEKGDILIAYTDGLEPIISSKNFTKFVKKREIKDICKKKIQTEGTAVILY